MHRFGFGALKQTVMDHGDATAGLSGTVSIGSTLTCTFNNNDPDGAAIVGPAYQWQRDSVDIGGETASTYTIVGGDAGHLIRCKVTYTDPGGTAETIFSPDSGSISAPLTASFVVQTGSASGLTTYSFTGVSVGTAAASRWTILCVFGFGSNRTVSSASLTGTGMTKLVDAGSGSSQPCAIFALLNPTGTTADFSITFSGAIAAGASIAVYSITGNSTITVEDFDSQINADPSGFTMNTKANGCWIVCGSREGSGAVTVGGMGTADYNIATTPSSRRAGANAEVTVDGTVTPSWDWSSALGVSCVGVSWRSGT